MWIIATESSENPCLEKVTVCEDHRVVFFCFCFYQPKLRCSSPALRLHFASALFWNTEQGECHLTDQSLV